MPESGYKINHSKAFLERFPDNRRSWVMNRFLACVRRGEQSPEAIVTGVWAEATAKARLSSPAERTKYLGLCLAIEVHPAEAASLAAYCLWWESLPSAERSRQKAESGARCLAEWMRRQPATQKQVMFLRQLGHWGPVGDRQAASAEIARRLAETRQ